MKNKRTYAYVGTVILNDNGKMTITDIGNFIYDTPFRLRVMGRGPRKHLIKKLKGKYRNVRHTLQSYLPLKYAVKADVYLRSRLETHYNRRGKLVFPKTPNPTAYKNMVRIVRGHTQQSWSNMVWW